MSTRTQFESSRRSSDAAPDVVPSWQFATSSRTRVQLASFGEDPSADDAPQGKKGVQFHGALPTILGLFFLGTSGSSRNSSI